MRTVHDAPFVCVCVCVRLCVYNDHNDRCIIWKSTTENRRQSSRRSSSQTAVAVDFLSDFNMEIDDRKRRRTSTRGRRAYCLWLSRKNVDEFNMLGECENCRFRRSRNAREGLNTFPAHTSDRQRSHRPAPHPPLPYQTSSPQTPPVQRACTRGRHTQEAGV